MIEFLYTVFQTWFYVTICAYCLWVYYGFKNYSYESAKHLYIKYGKYSKVVFCSEIIFGSILTACAWPLQLFVNIVEEHQIVKWK